MSLCVLMLIWEYPPIVEGGLARHVCKHSEAMVREGLEVHVLTCGDDRVPAEADQHGVIVHRVRKPTRPRDLSEFVTWVEHTNTDMVAAGVERGDRLDFDLVHGHDWLIGRWSTAPIALSRARTTCRAPSPTSSASRRRGSRSSRTGSTRSTSRRSTTSRRSARTSRGPTSGSSSSSLATHEAELGAQATELGARRARHVPGWIGDDVPHSLYRIADLCVIPSLYEPFGLVALEAMASGCPCIVGRHRGLREVVPPGERVGLRFNGGDAEHLGVMIERLLTDAPLRDRLVTEASEHVLRFDWQDIGKLTAAYAELLRAPSDAGRETACTDERSVRRSS